jgi:glycosyltransferase involved in cell wall biosynthesis
MKRVLAYTITRADTPQRARLLLDTVTHGVDQAGHKFDWHIFVNGDCLASDIALSTCRTGLTSGVMGFPTNRGQHPPTNLAIKMAIEGDYDYLVRIDDDVEWETKRWLAKLLEVSDAFDDRAIVAPHVRGLKFPVQTSEETFYTASGLPCKLAFDALGGICRLHPTLLLKEFPYHADTRQPMGFGDATGVARWASQNMIPMVVSQSIKIKHAKTTKGQEAEDAGHFSTHSLFQRYPWVPAWRPSSEGDAI